MSDTTKVLLEVNGGNVSVQVLEEQGGVLMLRPSSFFFHLGNVREITVPGKKPNTSVKVWQWACDDVTGQAGTKAKSIADMLADCGYEARPLTDTIPDLHAGL